MASSVRSNASSFGTPRSGLNSARSFPSSASESEFVTPRTGWSAGLHNEVRRGQRDSSHRNSSNSHCEQIFHSSRYEVAGDVEQPRYLASQHEPPTAQQDAIFSFARHGRVVDVESLLLRGVPVDSRDDNGNTILSIGETQRDKLQARQSLAFGSLVTTI